MLQISALSLKGEELQRRRPRDFNCPQCLSSIAGLDREITSMDTLLGACPVGAECIAAGKKHDQPLLFLSRAECASSARRHVFLYNFILFYIHSQYACANFKLCESSSMSSTSISSEEDRRNVEPFLRGEEPQGGLLIPESGAGSDGKGRR